MTAWIAGSAAVSAPAKVNLCLRVVGRRADGLHLLDSVGTPISLFDHLLIQVNPAHAPLVSIRCEPRDAAPLGRENLAVRAAELFMRQTGTAAQVSIALRKRIPAGTGLGGGSSDAAAVLRALNALLDVPVPQVDLRAWAVELGADVPLFVFGRPARMRGVGEILEPWPAAPRSPLVVAFAGPALETRTVYAKDDDLLTMADPPSTIRALTPGREPLPSMLHNDLEAAAFLVQPGLRSLKKRLCALGAEGVLMTGSGAAAFGMWKRWNDARAAAEQLRAAGVWARAVQVLDRVPAVELVAE